MKKIIVLSAILFLSCLYMNAQTDSTTKRNKWYFGLSFNTKLNNNRNWNYYRNERYKPDFVPEVIFRKRITDFPLHLLFKASYSRHTNENPNYYYPYPTYSYDFAPYYYSNSPDITRKSGLAAGLRWDYIDKKRKIFAVDIYNAFMVGYENDMFYTTYRSNYYSTFDSAMYNYTTFTKRTSNIEKINLSLLSGFSLTYNDKIEVGFGFDFQKSFSSEAVSGNISTTKMTSVIDTSGGRFHYRYVSSDETSSTIDDKFDFSEWIISFFLNFGVRF